SAVVGNDWGTPGIVPGRDDRRGSRGTGRTPRGPMSSQTIQAPPHARRDAEGGGEWPDLPALATTRNARTACVTEHAPRVAQDVLRADFVAGWVRSDAPAT